VRSRSYTVGETETEAEARDGVSPPPSSPPSHLPSAAEQSAVPDIHIINNDNVSAPPVRRHQAFVEAVEEEELSENHFQRGYSADREETPVRAQKDGRRNRHTNIVDIPSIVRESSAAAPQRPLAINKSIRRRPVQQNRKSRLSSLAPTVVDEDSNEEDLTEDPKLQSAEENMTGAFIPTSQQRHMRACMICSIVRTQSQFVSSGCPNCEQILELTGSPEAVQDCTSQVFEGLVTVSDTKRSWVARYQRLEGYVPGVYAIQVEGILPEDILEACRANGVNYIPRDGSANEAIPSQLEG
jgi:transcription elongation factor SPT4